MVTYNIYINKHSSIVLKGQPQQFQRVQVGIPCQPQVQLQEQPLIYQQVINQRRQQVQAQVPQQLPHQVQYF